MDVGVWLRSLGLGRYEVAFSDNSIDADILPDLTDGDLAQLGVNLGDRKRLLKAIASLGATYPVTKPTRPPPLSSCVDGAERRPITVMFCDLVGSTSMAAKLDAEDWRTLVNSYLDEASAAVTGLGGHVLKKLGDGLMALFGYPHAQENDAERAVRAALAIQRALVEINARNASKGAPELSARIGLDSGQVVVEATGEVFGDAPNIAARVQGAAEPGSILITAAVQRQTAGLFVAEDRGQHELKGMSAPMTLYRVVRASGGGRRGGARALTPLVGREDELALLARRWSRALEGEGQFVQIVGEPGIGKSRLIEEFRVKLAETPHTWVEWAASQLLQNTPLHPLAEWGRQRFGGADATDEGQLADLENTLRLVGLDPDEYAPLIAPLVGIPLPEARSAKFAPEELRRRQLAAVTAWYFAGARTQPAVLVFEDLHWADPTSLDLVRSLAERGAQAPLLIVATTRPEFRASWAMRSHHGVISLAPLDRAQVRRMVGEISSRHALSDEVVDGVSERTGGVPLFVEEVTRLLLERDAQGGAQAIPPTLQQSLAARLDRLGEAREVAQIGAVLGRDFSYRLLDAVAGVEPGRLPAALDRLVESDLVIVEGTPPSGSYRFKHALIRDAAYDSLLKSRRQTLHRRAAEALLAADAEPEPIAHHFTEAGLDDLAIEWWSKAGERALRTSAYEEAIAHLEKALALAGALAESPTQRLLRLRLQIAYGQALIHARGFASQETTAAFSRAREFASGIEEVTERFPVYYGLWASSWVRGELAQMREPAQAFLEDTKARPGTPEASIAHRLLGSTCWLQGDFVGARMHLENSLAIYNSERDRDFAFRFGQDSGVSAMIVLALTLWPLGEINRASQYAVEATTQAARSAHVATQAFAHGFKSLFEMMRRDAGCALHEGEVLLGFAQEHVMPQWLAIGTFTLGWARWHSGDREAGEREMRNGMALFREQGIRFPLPLCAVLLAEIEDEMGRIGLALTILDDALADAERTGQHHFDVELHRQRGALLLQKTPNDVAAAEAAFMRAIEVAHSQQTRTFELRAAMSRARLLRDQGKPQQARGLLAPVYGWFTEGFDTRDLKEAKALLEALAA